MEIEEWLGKDNQLGIDIWKRKYCYKEESFEQWLTRISGGNEKIAQLIREKKFLFGGRILANRGLEYVGRKMRLRVFLSARKNWPAPTATGAAAELTFPA